MSIQRLSFLSTILVGAAVAGFAGCHDDPPPTEPPIVDPPVDPEDQLTVISKVRPPPITGGTLLVSKDGTRAIVSDPDRDRIVVVDLSTTDKIAELTLDEGSEPGRVVQDSAGRAHIALRRTGKLVSIDIATGEKLSERAICPSPRGLAAFTPVEGGDETLVVACASGELVEIGAAPEGTILSSQMIEPDLRDVVIKGDGTRAGRRILVSSFRSAHVITVGPDFAVENESQPAMYRNLFNDRSFAPVGAWRMVDLGLGALMIHQRSATVPVEIEPEQPDGYGGQVFDCGSTISNAAMSTFDDSGQRSIEENRGGLGPILLPVDVAVTNTELGGQRYVAFIGAGNDTVGVAPVDQLTQSDACDDNFFNGASQLVGPEPISLAFGPVDPDTFQVDLVVQLREPSILVVFDGTTLQWKSQISLGGESRADSGHQLFHRNPEAPTTIACASCHLEGNDDSHTWQFTQIGARRTQSLAGDVMDTAPFHWDGDQHDLAELMETVFEHRMGGFPQSEERVEALRSWLRKIPAIPHSEPLDSEAVARGRALFESSEVGCATCHGGAKLTNNTTVTIGKGITPTQVPSLIGVRNRAPYMHDGCAPTLHARFDDGSCGGTEHGKTSQLSEQDIDDLVAYMESL